MRYIFTILCLLTAIYASAQIPTDAEVDKIIDQIIAKNPNMISENVDPIRLRQQLASAIKSRAAAEYVQGAIETDSTMPFVGNPNGSKIIIKVQDYNCGYCYKAFKAVDKLIENDDEVKVYLLHYPMFGESSLEKVKLSITIFQNYPDQFYKIHEMLYKYDASYMDKILPDMIDLETLRFSSKHHQFVLDKSINHAKTLGIRGTPGFIVNGRYIGGYKTYSELKRLIDN